MARNIKDLEDIGFLNVGEWKINQDNNRIYFDIDDKYLNEVHLLYAFAVNETVRYIGITENTLKNRMSLYKSGHNEKSSGSTNKNVYKQIKELLENKYTVNIYLLKDVAPCTFGGYEISLATGIEKSLIKAFDFEKTLWNKRGVKNSNIDKKINNKSNSKNVIVMDEDCKNAYYVTKTATTAHLGGIINFGEVPIESLPNYGEIVNVYLDDFVSQANFINANQQGGNNPRINSVNIGRWLTANHINVGNTFHIKICNNNSFYFYVNDIK